MPLSPGTRLGVYELTVPLGAGGMGEVWRARDTRLQRDVAIKVLPESLADDPDRLARLNREAQTLAALNHPNIAAIHGLEESSGVRALVMELVDGDDLSTLIARGAMPLAEALPIARQIADALEAAHEQGIIHRDLKPANIKVRRDGALKVLDFGLAKVMDPLAGGSGGRGPSGGALANSPTLTARATQAGMILGTAAYMAPEQARGRPVDRRVDIWAFGAVLYEMLTGRRAFEGEDISITLANVLKDDVDWGPLPAGLPPGVRRLLRRCLEKDPRRRLASMADARLELEDTEPAGSILPGTGATVSRAGGNAADSAARPGGRTLRLPVALALAAGAALATATLMRTLPAAPAPRHATALSRLSVALQKNDEVVETNRLPLALSPDGSMLVFPGRHDGSRQLFLRRLDERDPVPLPGTEGAATPFFSPDGQWIAFFAQTKLKRIAVGGAALQTVASDVPDPRGGAWGSDGTIYFAPTNMSGLFKVPASGGTPQPLTTLASDQGEISHRWPEVLPDGKSLLFTIWTGPGMDERRIVVQTLATGERHVLVPGGDSARYLPSGHLLYGRMDNLFAIPWQPSITDLSGAVPVTLPEQARHENEGASAYAVSPGGTLAYLPGGSARYLQRVVWVDRAGRTEPVPLPDRDYGSIALSPDGRRAAVQVSEGSIGIWIYDFERHTFTPFPTGPGSSQAPVWTPDGSRILYRGTRRGQRDIYAKASDGTGEEQRLTEGVGRSLTPTSISSDGRWLVFTGRSGLSGGESMIWRLRLDGSDQPKPLLPTAEVVNDGQISPDGRSMVYVSSLSGRLEIYATSFPDPGASQQVSIDGGSEPLWSRDGRTLYFQSRDVLHEVDVTPGTPPRFGRPRPLYEGRYRGSPNGNTPWSLSADGKRFLRVQQAQPDQPIDRIDVVLGWGDQVRRMAGGR